MVTHNLEHFIDLESKCSQQFHLISGTNHGSVDKSVQWIVEAGWSRVHLNQVRLALRVKQDVVAKQLVHVVQGLHLRPNNIFIEAAGAREENTSFFCPVFISSFNEVSPHRMLFTTKSSIWKRRQKESEDRGGSPQPTSARC